MTRKLAIVSLFAASLLGAQAHAQVQVLTHHNDNRRSGANLQETQLTVASVKQRFGRLWTLFADGQIVAQPLYVSGLNVAGRGTFNAVIVATMHNTIYVYDADKRPTQPQSADALLWAQWLGEPKRENFGFDSWNTNFPEYGVLGTPVIDAARNTLYVVSWHEANGGEFRLHAIDLAKPPFPGPGFPPPDYRDKMPPVVVGASIPRAGGGELRLDPTQQKQRAALLLDRGTLYVAFASNRETDATMHGWVVAYDAATLAQKAVWNATPSGSNGGIWQAGSGLAADADGNVYVMTGNGTFDADGGGRNFGDSFVKLRLENGQLAVKDWFTPCNQNVLKRVCAPGLEACDLDLGAAGPMLAPGPAGSTRVIGGGKDGNVFVLDAGNLGHYAKPADDKNLNCPNPNAVQMLLGRGFGPGVIGNIHGSHVFWSGPGRQRVFVWGENDTLRAYDYANGKLVLPPQRSLYKAFPGMPGGMLSVSANGTTPGTGIVWVLLPLNGDANTERGVRAQLLAFDARNVRLDLWRSEPLDASFGPNSIGLFAKFVPPTVANGKVFVATYGDQENPPGPARFFEGNTPPQGRLPRRFYVAVYGLKP
jgi:hypothetical protein